METILAPYWSKWKGHVLGDHKRHGTSNLEMQSICKMTDGYKVLLLP